MAFAMKGEALQVVKSENDNSFEVDENALSKILLDLRVRNSKVMIVSVAGAFRRGKSFLLNFFLKYLSSSDPELGTSDKTSHASINWMSDLNEPLLGFSWKGGSERTTSGILLWSEPFFITMMSGEKVCVLLMDTQGAFDSQSTVKECATVFALSTMISSVQVYNITGNIQEDDLQHLELFTEYGRLAMETYKDKPFQSLHFLVRDWQYPYQYAYGSNGGKQLLLKRLEIHPGQAFELQNLRQHLRQCFKDINCCLMPHPGLNVATNPNFKGSITDIEDDFRMHVKEFTQSVFSPKNVVVKTINGNDITGRELVEYFKAYIKVFQGTDLPEPKSMMEATAEANNLAAIANAKYLYTKEMENVCGGNKAYMNENLLAEKHNDWFIKAMNQFRSTRKMGGDDFCLKFELKLETELIEMFDQFQKNNKAKNVMSTAQTPVFFIALAVVSYILSGVFALASLNSLVSVFNLSMLTCIVCLFLWCYTRYTGQYSFLGNAMDTISKQCCEYFMQKAPPEINMAAAAGTIGNMAVGALKKSN